MLPIPMIFEQPVSISPTPQTFTFTAGTQGAIIIVPLSTTLIGASVSSADTAKFSFVLLETETNQTSSFSASVAQILSVYDDTVDYSTFDFAAINPTIDYLTLNSCWGVGATKYFNYSSGGQFFTFSGVEIKDIKSTPVTTGFREYIWHLQPNQSITFAQYNNSAGVGYTSYVKNTKAYAYNRTGLGSGYPGLFSYSASFSSVGMLHISYNDNLLAY